MSHGDLPPGYRRFTVAGADVVSIATLADAVQGALVTAGTLYHYGARHPRARRLSGRGVAYAVPLTDGLQSTEVVIRHNRHGGVLAGITGDRFLPPTRAPYELLVSERLRDAGVPTPSIVAYAVYRAGPLLRRSDVVTREIPDSADLAVAIMSPDMDVRARALGATAELITALTAAGARHHDLNVKNVLLGGAPGAAPTAYALDVDRVTFGAPNDPALVQANLARLLRSARKWRAKFGAQVSEAELTGLAAASGHAAPPRRTRS